MCFECQSGIFDSTHHRSTTLSLQPGRSKLGPRAVPLFSSPNASGKSAYDIKLCITISTVFSSNVSDFFQKCIGENSGRNESFCWFSRVYCLTSKNHNDKQHQHHLQRN